MDVSYHIGPIDQFNANAIVVNLFQGVLVPSGGTGALNQALGGVIEDELKHGNKFNGKLGDTMVFPTYGKLPARYVIVVGLGKQADFGSFQIRRAMAAAIRECQILKVASVATLLHGAGIGWIDPELASRSLVEGALLGNYKFNKRKTGKRENEPGDLISTIQNLTIVEIDADKESAIARGLHSGQAVAQSTNFARTLVFDSGNFVTPDSLATAAENIASQSNNIQCIVYEQEQLEEMSMGAFLSVAKGSDQPPKLIHLTYKPSADVTKKVTLVGKGITFDSGGLSLKPPKSQELMKFDMAGAAAVLSTMKGIGQLDNLDMQVDVVIPTCENMPSGGANKPGDIIRAMNGLTVEINNTDAEGRLILCDALTYAQKHIQPDEIIDLATLTGACITALGKAAAGIMGNNTPLIQHLLESSGASGEKLWQLPLFKEYEDYLKSPVADVINAGSKGEAGSSAAGTFLKAFVHDKQPWAHLDIAGPTWTDNDTPEIPKGATGFGVRTLLYYLYGWKEPKEDIL